MRQTRKPKKLRKVEPAPKKLSGLDAAHKVLLDSDAPMSATQIVERMLAAKLWTTAGKTPAATIYAAMHRECALKGEASRFRRAERGTFCAA